MSETMIQPLEMHPLPTDYETARDVFSDHPSFDDREGVPHPDVLRSTYMTVLAETHAWRVFRVDLYGFGGWVFVWNHQRGDGFRIPNDEGQFEMLAEALAQTLED
ncbi:hypothetical protein [Natrinema ejinorense]|uniref:hypothetical protein n=1 Tax=Natrinema ejinorense TaxID=373386 RepID=UPI001472CCF6|nr:hypothetical protein [Natrinema ejinorense]